MTYGFGALLILYAVALGVMSTRWFQRLLARRTTAVLEQITGARVEIGKFSFRPIIFQATLRGLVLHGKEPATAPPLFAAGTVVVGINPLSALQSGKLALRSLSLEDAEIHISTYADGSTNAPGPAGGAGNGHVLDDFLDLAVRRLNIARTNLYWNDEQVPLELSARDVALLLSARGLGRGSRYSGSLASSEVRLKATRWPLPPLTFSTHLEFSRDHLALTSLVWRSPGITGTGNFNLRRWPSVQAQLNWRANGNLKELARVFRVHELESGEVHGDGQVTYRNGDFEARGHVESRRLLVRSPAFDPGPVDLSTDFLADRRKLEASHLLVKFLGGTARGTVTAALAGGAPRFEARTRLQGVDLTEALNSIPQGHTVVADFLAAGRVNGALDAAWSGAFQGLASKFDLNFDATQTLPSQSSRPVSGFARGAATLAKVPVITLEAAELHFPHSVISGAGTLGAPQSALTFRVETSDFEEWRTLIESLAEAREPVVLKAPATFSGSLAGSLGRPQVQGNLRLGAFQYRGWDWDSLEAGIVATPDSIQVSSGKLLAGASSLAFDASASLDQWKLAPDALIQLTAHADREPLEGLRKALQVPYPLDGVATGRVNLDGRRSDLTGSGTVRIEHGAYAQEPFDLLAAQAKVSRSVWDLESIELVKGSGRLSGQAQVDPVARTIFAKAHGADFSLSDIKTLARFSGAASEAPKGEALTGHADFDVDARGSIDNTDVRATLDARALSVSGFALGDLHGKMEWSAHEATAQGDLEGPGGVFHFAGQVRTEGDWPAELSAQTTNVRADPWIRFLRLGKFGATVTATGSINLSGPLKNAGRLVMHSEISKVEVSFPGLKWENDRPIHLTLQNQTLTVSRFQLTGPSTRFEVEGSVRLAAPASFDLRAHGQIDASLLTALDPALLTTGGCDVELRASGSPQQPSIYGTVKVENVSLGYPNLPFRLSGLQGEVRLEGDRLTVTSLRGASGQGEISITGSATLSGTPRFDLRADLNQARVEYPVDFTSVLNGSLRLSGATSGAVLRGDLTVGQMFVSEDFNVLSWLGEISNQLPTPPGAASPVASKVRLEVHVTSAPAVSVDSHDLRLDADIGVTLRGSLAHPVAFGSVRINSGQAVLRGATYTLTRGSITMSNPVETQPVLDLEAQTRVQRYNLILNVTGPADRPRISYRSDPPLPTPDILALLAFGYSRQEENLTAGTGRSTFGTLGATALLSQALSGQTSSRIQRLFGLSRIAIDPNPSGAGGARVTVQEQVARDFTITYVNTTGGLQERIIQVEWDLSDKVSLLGVRDQNGVYGMELDFRKRFK